MKRLERYKMFRELFNVISPLAFGSRFHKLHRKRLNLHPSPQCQSSPRPTPACRPRSAAEALSSLAILNPTPFSIPMVDPSSSATSISLSRSPSMGSTRIRLPSRGSPPTESGSRLLTCQGRSGFGGRTMIMC